MVYKPILFNTEMVQAIQAGRKTQTRRVVKRKDGIEDLTEYSDAAVKRFISLSKEVNKAPCAPGDVLWVRETWCDPEPDNYMVPIFYKADMPLHWDAEDTEHGEAVDITAEEFKWRPSIHMPKEFARIFLRVNDVRLERLQNITEEQAVKEGCSAGYFNITCGPFGNDDDPDEWTAIEDFQRVWDSTIQRHPCKFKRHLWYWSDNPWVWVIEFEKIEKPEVW